MKCRKYITYYMYSYLNVYNKAHRIGMPARYYHAGDKYWNYNGKPHRINGYYEEGCLKNPPKFNILYSKLIDINFKKLVI